MTDGHSEGSMTPSREPLPHPSAGLGRVAASLAIQAWVETHGEFCPGADGTVHATARDQLRVQLDSLVANQPKVLCAECVARRELDGDASVYVS